MKRLAVVALVLAGCESKELEWYPIEPGGGGGTGGSTTPDAATDAGDASTMISGRVCLLGANLRTVSTAACATTGADNLSVLLGTSSATTTADGSFTLLRPATTSGVYWRVSGAGAVTSLVAYGAKFGTAAMPMLPVFDTIAYEQMVSDNQAASTQGVIVQVTKGSAVVSGATVQITPTQDGSIYYDDAIDAAWDTVNGTGAFGVAWIPSVAGTSAQLTVTSNAMQTVFTGIPLSTGALTFLTAEIP
jgi:hypothetical protein